MNDWTLAAIPPARRQPTGHLVRGRVLVSEPTDAVVLKLDDGREVDGLYSRLTGRLFEPYGAPLASVAGWRFRKDERPAMSRA